MKRIHERFMRKCLELAERGRGRVHPNPMVGSIVVRGETIVGEGSHEHFGGYHAELHALREAGRKARGGTLYVNLEPCAHFGKTPPCTDAIIRSGIRHVIAASKDPNPLVSGRGFSTLRRAGIRVTNGVLKNEAQRLNEKFFASMKSRLPFVGVKIAQTIDGRIADKKGSSKWISSPDALAYAHRLRSEYDAVLVGATTVRVDDPELTVRRVKGRHPVRVVLDGHFRISPSRKICSVRKAPTIVLTTAAMLKKFSGKAIALEQRGVQVLGIESGTTIPVRAVLHVLAGLGITSLLVEGGSTTLGHFFEQKVVKKVHGVISPTILGSGLTGLTFPGRSLATRILLDNVETWREGKDMILEGTPRYQ